MHYLITQLEYNLETHKYKDNYVSTVQTRLVLRGTNCDDIGKYWITPFFI